MYAQLGKVKNGPQWLACLDYLRSGDTVVIWALDRIVGSEVIAIQTILDLTRLPDAQAVAGVGRITRGNFRLIHRLFAQIERVMRINDLTVITSDVIETARCTLVT